MKIIFGYLVNLILGLGELALIGAAIGLLISAIVCLPVAIEHLLRGGK